MTTHIGLLRAVNLAGRNEGCDERPTSAARHDRNGGCALAAAERQRLAVPEARGRSSVQLERTLAQATKERLRRSDRFRSSLAGEWRELVADNPFPREAKAIPATSWRCA
mgnify:CR=1 FL=1